MHRMRKRVGPLGEIDLGHDHRKAAMKNSPCEHASRFTGIFLLPFMFVFKQVLNM
jgi:hypothetical protein